LHTGVHKPETHEVEPFALVHAVPHAPHAATVVSEVSQPLAALPSQLPHPELHEIEHAPSVHVAVPFVLLQIVPHVPQLFELVCVFVSQPFATVPSQLP
jgi:hypothetical protein